MAEKKGKTYLEYINDFWDLVPYISAPPGAWLLYLFMMQRLNRLHWRNNFTMTNSDISLALHITTGTLNSWRQWLQDVGLISYEAGGSGRGDSGTYTIREPNIGPIYERYQNLTPKKDVRRERSPQRSEERGG